MKRILFYLVISTSIIALQVDAVSSNKNTEVIKKIVTLHAQYAKMKLEQESSKPFLFWKQWHWAARQAVFPVTHNLSPYLYSDTTDFKKSLPVKKEEQDAIIEACDFFIEAVEGFYGSFERPLSFFCCCCCCVCLSPQTWKGGIDQAVAKESLPFSHMRTMLLKLKNMKKENEKEYETTVLQY